MPDAGILATIMLLVGLFLLGLEFFIPSFGMILILSIISLVVSFWSACKAWYGTSPMFFWAYIFTGGLGVPGSLLGAIWLMQRTSLGKRIILQGPGNVPRAESPLQQLVGRHGEAQTTLAPGGMVEIDQLRYHAESIGMIIDPQTPVVVVGVKGNRVVVKPAGREPLVPATNTAAEADPAVLNSGEPQQAASEGQAAAPPGESPDHLDFDIPDD